jgi:hypothetical protein
VIKHAETAMHPETRRWQWRSAGEYVFKPFYEALAEKAAAPG